MRFYLSLELFDNENLLESKVLIFVAGKFTEKLKKKQCFLYMLLTIRAQQCCTLNL